MSPMKDLKPKRVNVERNKSNFNLRCFRMSSAHHERRAFEENRRLVARISKLEGEISRLKGSLPLDDFQYKEVFDRISACLFVIDVTPDNRFKFVAFNRAEQEAVGLSNEQIAGKFVEQIFAPDLAQQLVSSYRRPLATGEPVNYDSELDLPAGRRFFHTNLIPFRNPVGRIHRIIGACIDITDFRRSQEEALARQKLESLGLLAGGVAHDFGNLLGSISAESELLMADLPEDSSVRVGLTQISDLAMHAGKIVRELMAYAGQEGSILEDVNISDLVAEMLHLLKPSISKRAVLRVDLQPNLSPIQGSSVQIRQVILNLVMNASEALADQEGAISLKVRDVPRQDLRTEPDSDSPPGSYIQLTISDTGCGMTQEIQAKAFDPFYTTKGKGRGLGLAAVQGIVRAHRGTINVSSDLGRGTRFEVLLPAIDRSQLPVRAKISPVNVSVGGTVLIVEDEKLLRCIVSSVFHDQGLAVIEAADGETAIELFRANLSAIDAVLLDLTLPVMSGQQVFQELRRLRPDIRVVFTTAYSQDIEILNAASEKPWGFIRKPYKLGELAALLKNECLARRTG
jgi:two-component system cell cycle sensor histidine kinase/response regulator CckA